MKTENYTMVHRKDFRDLDQDDSNRFGNKRTDFKRSRK